MASGIANNRHLHVVVSTSGITEPPPGVAELAPDPAAVGGLRSAAAETLVDYAAALDSSPLAASSRGKYRQRVAGYLDWIIGEAAAGRLRGDPLTEQAPRDWAVRDYRRHLKVDRKLSATGINDVLAALDDFHTRLGLGPAAVRREDTARRIAPAALTDTAARHYIRAIERLTSPRDRLIAGLPYYAGLRIGEVVALDVQDAGLSARKGQLRILGKGRDDGKLRTVRCTPNSAPCSRPGYSPGSTGPAPPPRRRCC
jgi:integrase/recombinase XerC